MDPMEIEIILVWAILVTVGLVILLSFLIRTRMKYENKFEAIKFTIEKERAEQEEKFRTTVIEQREAAKESSRYSLKGRIGEQMSPLFPEFYSKYQPSDARFLGSPIDYIIFKDMSKYDRTTKAEDVPIDVVLVEVKSGKNTGLTQKERAVRIAVEEGRVSFDVIKQNIEPQKEPTQKEPTQKNEQKKEHKPIEIIKKIIKKDSYIAKQKEIYTSAYERWTKEDDEFLEKFWNDNSNKQNRDELIQELSKRFKRNIGGIKARLEKLGIAEF